MRKVLVLCVVLLLSMALFAGCGQQAQPVPAEDVQQSQQQEQAPPAAEPSGEAAADGDAVMDPSQAELIGEDAAKQIAVDKVSGASVSDIRQFDLDYDDGRWEYEGELYKGEFEYEFEINAESGEVLKWEQDHIYD